MSAAAIPAEAPAALPARYSWEREVPRTASTRRRAVAFLVDAFATFALAWTFTFFAATAGFLRIPDYAIGDVQSPVVGLFWIVSIFELPLQLLYFTLFEAFGGRTPGKLLASLRVTKVDGSPIGVSESFLRNLLRLLWVTPFGPAFLLLDVWSLRTTELDQRMGDLAAGTIVVHASERL